MPERKQDGRRAKSPDRRNDEYEALRQLKAPSADARALARVLGDHDIGGFHVDVVLNESANRVEEQIEDLFAESHSEDLLLLHFSCHGLKSEAGELFFAARNTRPDRLASTAIAADFIQRCIKSCRARRIVLFLDCCYGGAFGQGVSVRASGSANVLESFPSGKLGGGKGRAVITASSSMEYAFEGNALADDHQQQPSLFTSALVRGLETGEADSDEDGLVSLNELYDYVFDKVRQQNPNQTPSRDVEMQGELYVAQSRREKVRPLPIPAEVQTALQDRNMFTRLGAVGELRARMNSEDLPA
ncbi:MAG TPA: caspase family protein, partial [Dermatophilaceae bacterium]